jgi:hypothetical protein
MHRGKHFRVLTHPEVIVAAPHGDVTGRTIRMVPHRLREIATLSRDINEGPVSPLVMQTVQGNIQRGIIGHFSISTLQCHLALPVRRRLDVPQTAGA